MRTRPTTCGRTAIVPRRNEADVTNTSHPNAPHCEHNEERTAGRSTYNDSLSLDSTNNRSNIVGNELLSLLLVRKSTCYSWLLATFVHTSRFLNLSSLYTVARFLAKSRFLSIVVAFSNSVVAVSIAMASAGRLQQICCTPVSMTA